MIPVSTVAIVRDTAAPALGAALRGGASRVAAPRIGSAGVTCALILCTLAALASLRGPLPTALVPAARVGGTVALVHGALVAEGRARGAGVRARRRARRAIGGG